MPDPTAGSVLAGNTSQPAPPPDSSSLPVNSGQPPIAPAAAPTAPAPVAQTPAPQHDHHTAFGMAVKNLGRLLQGQETTYVPNPQTGQVDEVTRPARPGAVFSRLLLGALVGGAAASAPTGSKDGEGRHTTGGFLSGVARGGAAAQANAQTQDAAKFERAREQVRMGQENQRLTDEHMLHQATAAHLTAQTTSLAHQMHLQDAEQIEKHNAAARAYATFLTDNGALPGKVSIGGDDPTNTARASDLAAAFTKDPSILKASSPDYVRHFVLTTDASELRPVTDASGHLGWQKEDGSPVNMADVGTVKILDVPTRTFKTQTMVEGSAINKARGQKIVDESKRYSLSPEGMSTLYSLNLSDANKKSLSAQRDAAARKSNAAAAKAGGADKATEDAIKSQINIAKSELTAANKSLDDDAIKAAQEKLNDLYGQLEGLKKKPQAKPTVPKGKALVYDPQGTPHYVDRQKLNSFLKDPQFKGWYQ